MSTLTLGDLVVVARCRVPENIRLDGTIEWETVTPTIVGAAQLRRRHYVGYDTSPEYTYSWRTSASTPNLTHTTTGNNRFRHI